MRIAALQFDVAAADPDANLAAAGRGLAEASERGVELVLLPEMWTVSFVPESDLDEGLARANAEAVRQLGRWTAEYELAAAGSAFGPRTGPRGLPTNRLTLFDRGARRFDYDKAHLFTPTAETESFSAGDAPPPTVEVRGAEVSGVVCYDLRFPELLRVPFRAGCELLLVAAQWPASRADHWNALLRGRAVESQCFVLGANRTGTATVGRRRLELDFPGNSQVVSPHGRVLTEGRGEPGLVVADVDLEEARAYRRSVPVEKDERRDLHADWARTNDGRAP